MTYEQARLLNPTTLEEAIEKVFWKAAGRGCLGVTLPETWAAVATAAREFTDERAARFERGIRAIAKSVLVGLDFGAWVQNVCEDLLDGNEAECPVCGTPVHNGPCVGDGGGA